MDHDTDDLRTPNGFELAEKAGISFKFMNGVGQSWHPNTAKIEITNGEKEISLVGSSISGGNIQIIGVNGFQVQLSGIYQTLVILNHDHPGMIADVTNILKRKQMNISHMDVDRKGRSS